MMMIIMMTMTVMNVSMATIVLVLTKMLMKMLMMTPMMMLMMMTPMMTMMMMGMMLMMIMKRMMTMMMMLMMISLCLDHCALATYPGDHEFRMFPVHRAASCVGGGQADRLLYLVHSMSHACQEVRLQECRIISHGSQHTEESWLRRVVCSYRGFHNRNNYSCFCRYLIPT